MTEKSKNSMTTLRSKKEYNISMDSLLCMLQYLWLCEVWLLVFHMETRCFGIYEYFWYIYLWVYILFSCSSIIENMICLPMRYRWRPILFKYIVNWLRIEVLFISLLMKYITLLLLSCWLFFWSCFGQVTDPWESKPPNRWIGQTQNNSIEYDSWYIPTDYIASQKNQEEHTLGFLKRTSWYYFLLIVIISLLFLITWITKRNKRLIWTWVIGIIGTIILRFLSSIIFWNSSTLICRMNIEWGCMPRFFDLLSLHSYRKILSIHLLMLLIYTCDIYISYKHYTNTDSKKRLRIAKVICAYTFYFVAVIIIWWL